MYVIAMSNFIVLESNEDLTLLEQVTTVNNLR